MSTETVVIPNDRYTDVYDWVLSDQYRILFHILFWLFVYSDKILALLGFTGYSGLTPMYTFLTLCIDAALVYLNLYILIPRFLLQGKIWYYLFFTVISIFINLELAFTLTFPVVYDINGMDGQQTSALAMLVDDFVETASVLGMAMGIHIVRRFLRNQKKLRELQTASLKTELAFLKHQINPHFLFNSLNNIYVQNRKKPADASESILLLSDLLRYQLYDCAKEKVYLKGEIEYLKNYLKLDKLRKNISEVDFDVEGSPEGKLVAPFIFIPFVENAVKHGLSIDSESFIKIQFILREQELKFSIKNSKPQNGYQKLKGGIGLTNVKRRLNLLYPNKYQLDVRDGESSYIVKLNLLLN
ncbi:MAG: histidine kinase [Bacteroidota bacterium]